jgi:hypothetical protein
MDSFVRQLAVAVVTLEVATIILRFSHPTNEVWAATEWDKLTELARYLPPVPASAQA